MDCVTSCLQVHMSCRGDRFSQETLGHCNLRTTRPKEPNIDSFGSLDLTTIACMAATERSMQCQEKKLSVAVQQSFPATLASKPPGVSGPDNDRTIFPTSLCGPKISGPEDNQIVWSLCGPEISGPDNDQMVWSLSGPGRCLVLLHRARSQTRFPSIAYIACRRIGYEYLPWLEGTSPEVGFVSMNISRDRFVRSS